MEASDPSELVEANEAARESREKTRAALIVAILAAFLAISSYGGSNATKDALKEDIAASNLYAFYQARKIRQTAYSLAADNLSAALPGISALDAATKTSIEKTIARYRAEETSLESKPETKDGMKELLARAKEREAARDRALQQDPNFDYASALMQIGVVVVSVSIITGVSALLWGGAALGAVGLLFMLNGFFLLIA